MNNRQKGFTLIELMVTLALMALILGFAASPFREMVINNRIASEGDNLIATLNFVRSEAIKRNTPVWICKSPDGVSCSADDSDGWEDGWIIFVDTNNNGAYAAADDELLKKQGPIPGDTSISVDTIDDLFGYQSNGTLSGAIGTLSLCSPDDDKEKSRNITISVTGRPSLSKGSADSTCPDPA